ncbi:MAG: protein kinase, partial [Myxococcales bacterium]|nr:protein kinase [Myxococcales bacterium]
SGEIRAVLERLRSDALVVVAGDSGVGKSSLCKAGVAPLVDEGQLDPNRQWASASITPGRYPLPTLIDALARLFELDEDTLEGLVKGGAEELVRALRRQLGEGRGRLLVIDQFEELATLADPGDVAVVGPLLAHMTSGIPGLRVLATVRGDFLTRVAQVPGVGDELSRAIYILRPLTPEGARDAIVGPARVKGVSFENEALVDELVHAGSRGSLPLLQFALAELWETRDPAALMITTAELRKIGGVTGALARHGDAAIAELIPEQRVAARRVLMRLVSVDDTRAVRTEEELVAGSAPARAALKALVRSRLVVAREVADQAVFEIAHEALLGGWATLSGWLEEERESRAIHHRLELAVAEWERLGRGRDGVLSGAPLQEVLALDPSTLRPRERAFIAACREAAARMRMLRRVAAVALPVVALLTYG